MPHPGRVYFGYIGEFRHIDRRPVHARLQRSATLTIRFAANLFCAHEHARRSTEVRYLLRF